MVNVELVWPISLLWLWLLSRVITLASIFSFYLLSHFMSIIIYIGVLRGFLFCLVSTNLPHSFFRIFQILTWPLILQIWIQGKINKVKERKWSKHTNNRSLPEWFTSSVEVFIASCVTQPTIKSLVSLNIHTGSTSMTIMSRIKDTT